MTVYNEVIKKSSIKLTKDESASCAFTVIIQIGQFP